MIGIGSFLNLVLYLLLLNNFSYLEIKSVIRTPLDPAEDPPPPAINRNKHMAINALFNVGYAKSKELNCSIAG